MKRWLIILIVACAATGCSIKRFAVNRVGNALAGSGTSFSSDNDPELIREAVPFSLKLMESLLAESPEHRGLLLGCASGFTQYAYAFVQEDADELETKDVAGAKALRERTRKLYLRGRDYGLRGLELNHRGFGKLLQSNPKKAVALAGKRDVPLLYWTAAAWGAAISVSKDHPEIVADLPKMEALIDRALELDETFEHGAIHSFLISYETARPGTKPSDALARARQHFERAVALSGGLKAAVFVSYAETVCVKEQKRADFEIALKKALAIDVDQRVEWRLANLIAQRRARWLLGRTEELFVE